MPYFPNYLSLASPFAFLGLNFFNTMEYQMRHMDRLFSELKRRGATHLRGDRGAPTPAYRDRMTEMLGDSLWTIGNCATSRSYYFNPQGEPTLLRPMSTAHGDQRSIRIPVERLSDCVIREDQLCRGRNSRAAKFAGLAIAGVGLAHFTSPRLFDGITKQAFPRNSRQHLYINGGIETALGLGFCRTPDPAAAVVGTIGYVAYLAGNVARNR